MAKKRGEIKPGTSLHDILAWLNAEECVMLIHILLEEPFPKNKDVSRYLASLGILGETSGNFLLDDEANWPVAAEFEYLREQARALISEPLGYFHCDGRNMPVTARQFEALHADGRLQQHVQSKRQFRCSLTSEDKYGIGLKHSHIGYIELV